MTSKYKIINTTIKPPRPNPRTGEDMRPAVEKVGHNVKLRMGPTEEIMVERHRPRIINSLDEGILRAQRAGFIRIEEIENVNEVLKKHTLSSEDKSEVLFSADEHAGIADLHATTSRRGAKAVEMGKDTYAQNAGTESSEAINPDGDPNFLVRADKSVARKTRPVNREESPVAAKE